MLFNSLSYAFFLPVVALLYASAPRGARWALLLAASYAFYATWNASYLLLLLASTALDYTVARQLARTRSAPARRALLGLSIAGNLGMLFTFKYWGFAAMALGQLGVRVPRLDVLLPVGISFYTFQTLGYAIDVYRGARPERHAGWFALYVAFFPQLVAGPIERAGRLLPQLRRAPDLEWARVCSGLELVLWGLFKKVVIADRLALYVDAVYGNPGLQSPGSALLATYAFAIQIWCDFAGYTDIARGSARIFGVELMENFRAPYFARGVQDFWRRWHVSLSTWLRDYLYIPLGGSRQGAARTARNLMLTMLLGGLWHGASWTFVVWGGLHGVFLVAARASAPLRERLWAASGLPDALRAGLARLVTFHLVCLAWVFFRAETLADATALLGSLAGPWRAPAVDASVFAHALLGLALLIPVEIARERGSDVRARLAALPLPLRWASWYALIFAVVLLGVDGGSQFIYFQF